MDLAPPRPRRHKDSLARVSSAAETSARLTLAPRLPHAPPQLRSQALRLGEALWILALLSLFALHFPHLLADFPNHSPWLDPARYTDEGWYANAAIRHFVSGRWFLHGDFNPAVALPVWPLLLTALFHFTGVSLAADRALALVVCGCNLLLVWRIVRTQSSRWTAHLAVTLLLSSPFFYAFSRLALLEPLLMCFLLLSWLLALQLPGASTRAQTLHLAAIGLLFCLMILTKTTAIFILPSTLFLIARAYRFRWTALRALVIAAGVAALSSAAYYFLLVRPRYRVDYQYLFDANHWAQPTTFSGWIAAFWYALHGSLWISPTLCISAVVLLGLTLFPTGSSARSATEKTGLWHNPLTFASLLTAAGYIFFAGWHNNPQPRYYETVIYPLCLLLAIGTAALLHRSRPFLLRIAGALVLAVMAVVSVDGAVRIVHDVRHPEYTFLNAARGVTRFIDQHPGQRRLLLSISGDNIQLITGLPSICDDYGTWDLPWRIHVYQPGWFATWNEIDPGTLADLQTQYSLERVAAFPAFDDPDRNLLILYRMTPLPASRQVFSMQDEIADNAGK